MSSTHHNAPAFHSEVTEKWRSDESNRRYFEEFLQQEGATIENVMGSLFEGFTEALSQRVIGGLRRRICKLNRGFRR